MLIAPDEQCACSSFSCFVGLHSGHVSHHNNNEYYSENKYDYDKLPCQKAGKTNKTDVVPVSAKGLSKLVRKARAAMQSSNARIFGVNMSWNPMNMYSLGAAPQDRLGLILGSFYGFLTDDDSELELRVALPQGCLADSKTPESKTASTSLKPGRAGSFARACRRTSSRVQSATYLRRAFLRLATAVKPLCGGSGHVSRVCGLASSAVLTLQIVLECTSNVTLPGFAEAGALGSSPM